MSYPCQSDVKADGPRVRSRAHHLGIDAHFKASRQANPRHRAYIIWSLDVTLAREGSPPRPKLNLGTKELNAGAEVKPGHKGAHRRG